MQFKSVQWYDSLESTNTFLHAMLEMDPHLPMGTVIAAHQQTAGRGRKGRCWQGGANRNLTFSYYITKQIADARQKQDFLSLPLLVGLCVADALETFGIPGYLKWPNDIQAGAERRKICGILSEHVSLPIPATLGAVVGIGLNVNMDSDEASLIDQPATSMAIEAGRDFALESVLQAILRATEARLSGWLQHGLAAIKDDWLARCEWVGQPITVRQATGREVAGRLVGLDDIGQLVLEIEESPGEFRLQSVSEGDVHLVRKSL